MTPTDKHMKIISPVYMTMGIQNGARTHSQDHSITFAALSMQNMIPIQIGAVKSHFMFNLLCVPILLLLFILEIKKFDVYIRNTGKSVPVYCLFVEMCICCHDFVKRPRSI